VVLGYIGEPFLRIDRSGVAVNASSPTAAATKLATRGRGWQLRSRGRTIVWHDARVRALPGGVKRREWSVPVVVDGRRVSITGEIRRVSRPTVWPWVALGAPFVGLAVLLVRRRRRALGPVAVVLGTTAAGMTIVTAASFALARTAAVGRWIEGLAELAFAAAGVLVVVRGSADARAVAGGALGLVGLSSALTKLPVYIHGVVLAAVPATLARAVVAVTFWESLATAAVGWIVFFDLLEREDRAALAYRPSSR
jgi:hypothetical protein